MKEAFFYFFISLFILYLLWVLISLEKRVIRKIKKEALKRNLEIKTIRDPKGIDGDSPFTNFRISFGSSQIFGISGARRYVKILEVEQKKKTQKYWVQVDTVFFIPSNIIWHYIPLPPSCKKTSQ